MTTATATLAEISATWAPTASVAEAAAASGYSAAHLYRAIAKGECPFQTIRVGGKIRIITASLIRVLSGEPDPVPPAPSALRVAS
ncbi:helix-turn-helix domain-containing protein [Streptomyces tendae]|uniref:helix-turn-helix domain-containing protein n=1 Tax=Streptomyces tendae TaxID=1932 RepID=UPI00369CAC87